MAPFRSSARSSRNANPRSAIDHDVFEGLPIRQWRLSSTSIAPPSPAQPHTKDALPELPMPREWQLLPEVTQHLLRAARAGKVWKAPPPPHSEDKDHDDDEGEKLVQKGFVAKKWTIIPRHAEAAEPEFLAKRRKGLPSLHQITTTQTHHPPPPPRSKSKSKRVDHEATAQPTEAVAPGARPVEGEPPIEAVADVVATEEIATPIIKEVTMEDAVIPTAEAMAQSTTAVEEPTTPVKPRSSSSKRKQKKSHGKSKKKVMFTDVRADTGEIPNGDSAVGDIGEDNTTTAADLDTSMANTHGGSSEEEGEEDHDDGELSSGDGTPSMPLPIPAADSAPVKMESADTSALPSPDKLAPPPLDKKIRDPSSSPEMPLVSVSHSRQNSLQDATLPADLSPLPTSVSNDTAEELKDTEMQDVIAGETATEPEAIQPPLADISNENPVDEVDDAEDTEMDIDSDDAILPVEATEMAEAAALEEQSHPTPMASATEPEASTEASEVPIVPIEPAQPIVIDESVPAAEIVEVIEEVDPMAQIEPEKSAEPSPSQAQSLPAPSESVEKAPTADEAQKIEEADMAKPPSPVEAEPALTAEVKEPEKPIESDETARPTESTESTEPVAEIAAEPVLPEQPVESIESVEPMEAVESAEPAEPGQKEELVENVAPADSTSQIEATAAAETSESTELKADKPADDVISKPTEPVVEASKAVTFPDGEVDLFGSLEAHLEKESSGAK